MAVLALDMKKLLILPLVALALFIGTNSFVPVAHADARDSGVSNTQLDANGKILGTDGASTMSADQAAAQKAAANTVTDPSGMGSSFGPVMTWIASLFAWLVGVAALTLDYAVYFTVITMGDYVHKLTAIGLTWRILRDIGNIALIFGFLAIGISTILNTERLGWGKKMLPMLLVAAVFINFSLFFTEAVIDMGNIFATQFFTQINGGEQPTADFLSKTTIGSEGISNKIMAQVGLQTIYTQGQVKSDVFRAGNTWTIGFMSILLFIVTAFVMFSLAFILVARFVFLVFLIILAPLGFAGLAIPQLAGRAKWWWDSLFEQTITAPVLLLLLYIALAVITDASFLTGLCIPAAGSSNTSCTSNWVGYVDGNFQGFASMILTFIIAMGLLLIVIIASKRLSAVGASGASKLAGKLTFGMTAWAGRNTVGWGANKSAKYLKSTKVGRVPLVGTGLVKGLDKLAGGSFDVRGVKAGGGLKTLNVDAGDAQKGGYKADLKARTESRTKYASELTGKKLTDTQIAEIAEIEQKIAKKREEQKKEGVTAARILELNEDIKRLGKDIEEQERETSKGAQRKYADTLELSFLKKFGVTDKGLETLNKLNPAANMDAAKKIREDAKKSSDDKSLDALRKALKKASGEEEPAAPAAPAGGAGGGAPAGGGH